MTADELDIWTCPMCIAQMCGGPRCYVHNPTPEQRAERERLGTAQPRASNAAPRVATPKRKATRKR